MKKRKLLLLISTISIVTVLAVFHFSIALAAEKANPITLKIALYHPATAPCTQIWHSYEPKFEQLTGGAVLLKVFDSSTLVKGSAHVDAVQRSMADLAFSWPPYLGRTFPIADIGVQPGIWRDLKGIRESYENGVTKILEEDYASHGLDNVSVICMQQMGEGYLITKEQVKVPSDLKGLKIRPAGVALVKLFKLCGASPTSMRIGETYEALQRGIIDGSNATLGNLHDYKWPEQAKYLLDLPLYQAPMQLIASKKSLAKIPDDLRPLVIELLKSCMTRIENVRTMNNLYYHKTYLRKKGVIFYTPTDEEEEQWNVVQKKVLEEWIEKAGDRGKRALAIAEKYNKK